MMPWLIFKVQSKINQSIITAFSEFSHHNVENMAIVLFPTLEKETSAFTPPKNKKKELINTKQN
jgi:hypothetical protein